LYNQPNPSAIQQVSSYTNFSNVSPLDPNVTLPRISTDRHQMAGDITKLNAGVPRPATRWQYKALFGFPR